MDIRVATASDAEILFAWRNDSLTRAMFITQDPVEWDGHIAWLTRRLSRENPELYIAEIDGVAVGTVRLDDGELSYTVAPEHRGKGHAKAMLMEVARLFGPKLAKIKPENIASIRAAKHAGHTVVLL